MSRDCIFTSESVTAGHPDKLCDQISDAIVGRFLRQDPLSRVVAECAVANGIVFVAVKLASRGSVDIPFTVREVIADTGYEHDGFNARACAVMTTLSEFDPREPAPVDEEELDDAAIERVTAREPVTVFGFACTHTPALMPMPIWLSHKLARQLAEACRAPLSYLNPDGKTQVAVELRDRRPSRIFSLTLAASRGGPGSEAAGAISLERLRRDLVEAVVEPAFVDEALRPDGRTRIDVNPDGLFGPGGPSAHSGLTGRKAADDTYGDYARHGSAALSGKDPTRIDRVAAYAARHAARNVVAASLAAECEVVLSYSIGQSRPVSVQVETFGTGRLAEEEILRRLQTVCDFRPAAIIRRFGLRRLPGRHPDGFYRKLGAYGQVGRPELDLPWEQDDLVDALT